MIGKKIEDRKVLREWYKERYDALVASFAWNTAEENIPIIPVIHGTDAKIGKHICSAGFAALSSLDAGYYGKGIYFTSSCLYATPYFGTKPEPAIIICFIIPGNVRPIVEHKNENPSFLGIPIDSGYQSHYVLTNKDGNPIEKKKDRHYDEFVLASDPQVVPVFLIYISKTILPGLIKEFTRDIPGDEKGVQSARSPRDTKKSKNKNPIPSTSQRDVREMPVPKESAEHKSTSESLLPEENVNYTLF